MRVWEIMSDKPVCCRTTDHLADVAWKMYEGDCGVLPVLGAAGEAVGMITDRDIAIATMTRNKPPSEIFVSQVMTGKVHACGPEDKLESALETMAAERVRRLPVLDAERRVVGVLSTNDLILRLGRATTHLALTRHVLTALHRICEHSHQEGGPTASEALENLGRYRQTEEAVGKAALLKKGAEQKKKTPKRSAARGAEREATRRPARAARPPRS
jgi:CBS domain-containing protein